MRSRVRTGWLDAGHDPGPDAEGAGQRSGDLVKRFPGFEPHGPADVEGGVGIAKPEPGVDTQGVQMLHQDHGVSGTPPAMRSLHPGQRVQHRVDIGRYGEPVDDVVIADVDHHRRSNIGEMFETPPPIGRRPHHRRVGQRWGSTVRFRQEGAVTARTAGFAPSSFTSGPCGLPVSEPRKIHFFGAPVVGHCLSCAPDTEWGSYDDSLRSLRSSPRARGGGGRRR